jgi:hypothetical protein
MQQHAQKMHIGGYERAYGDIVSVAPYEIMLAAEAMRQPMHETREDQSE